MYTLVSAFLRNACFLPGKLMKTHLIDDITRRASGREWGSVLRQNPSYQKDSCNLMWTAERPRSAELKLQILELKQKDLDRIKTRKQRRTLIRIIKKIENWTPFTLYILQLSLGAVLLTPVTCVRISQ